jgi:hypothetical protein
LDFLNVIEAERALLDFQLEEIAGQTQHELARQELTVLIAGVRPEPALVATEEKTASTAN